MKLRHSFAALLSLGLLAPPLIPSGFGSDLQVIWNSASGNQPLKSWSLGELKAMKAASSTEIDPTSGKSLKWKGVLFSRLIEDALSKLSVEQKAQIDLVILKNGAGGQALIPRYLITKYPLLVAHQKDGSPLESALAVVVPVSSAPKINNEGLPLSAYSLQGVDQIELTSYGFRFSSLFLKRRTDPAAIRGEKMFVRNCLGCHGVGNGRTLTDLSSGGGARSLASTGHPQGPGVPRLDEREVRALASYLEAYRNENPSAEKSSASVPAAAPAAASKEIPPA